MSGPAENPLKRIVQEVHRRSLWQVLGIYVVSSWVVYEAVQSLTEGLGLPGWFPAFAFVLLLIGLPIVLATAFVQEGGPGSDSAGEPVSELEDIFAEEAEEGEADVRGAHTFFTWRNAILGGTAAFALWGFVAAGWLLFGSGIPATSSSDGSGVRVRSIAVLPFQNMGGEESAQFTQGVHDGLLTRLSNVSDLQVISRTSVRQYRDTEKTIPEIARDLNVGWVVEGAVQQAGGRVQVNAQLIRAPDDAHQWAETYRRELTPENLFAIQGELTMRIARSLEAELTAEETERVEREPTQDLEAYRLYAQGRGELWKRTEAGIGQAVRYFQHAIERDSSYARAWAGLADALRLVDEYGRDLEGAPAVTAGQAAQRALALDSTVAEAHASYGFSASMLGFEAVRRYHRAIELNSSYSQAYHWLANAEILLGRLDSAVVHLEHAVEVDPLEWVPRAVLSMAYHLQGRQEEALLELRQVKKLVGEAPGVVSVWDGWMLSTVGRQEEALAAFERGYEGIPRESHYRGVFAGWEGVAHARAEQRIQAEEVAAGLDQVQAPALKRSLIYAALGDVERAASALSDADPAGWDGFISAGQFRYTPILEPLRDTPEYRSVLRELNASLGLHPDGSLPDSVDLPLGPQTRG